MAQKTKKALKNFDERKYSDTFALRFGAYMAPGVTFEIFTTNLSLITILRFNYIYGSSKAYQRS